MKKIGLIGLVPAVAIVPIITTSCNKNNTTTEITRDQWFTKYSGYYSKFKSLVEAGTKYTKDDISIVYNNETVTVDNVIYEDGPVCFVSFKTKSGAEGTTYIGGTPVDVLKEAFPDANYTHYYVSGDLIKISSTYEGEQIETTYNSNGYITSYFEKTKLINESTSITYKK